MSASSTGFAGATGAAFAAVPRCRMNRNRKSPPRAAATITPTIQIQSPVLPTPGGAAEVVNENGYGPPIVFPATSRTLESMFTTWFIPAGRARDGFHVTTLESALQENTPLMSGVIVNPASTEAWFIGSLNVMTIVGVRFVPAPRGDVVMIVGRVTSTTVHVSFPTGAGSTFPARSVARDRNAYRWPSAPM